jgi:hypothetical protein
MNDQNDLRELAGPYLVLGVDKDVDSDEIEAHYQSQCRAVERGECSWSIDDLEWAKQVLCDPEQRLAADRDSLNPDLASGEVQRLARLYRLDGSPPGWEPMDPEPPIDFSALYVIDSNALASTVPTPDIPRELPAVKAWLDHFSAAATDPWSMELFGN